MKALVAKLFSLIITLLKVIKFRLKHNLRKIGFSNICVIYDGEDYLHFTKSKVIVFPFELDNPIRFSKELLPLFNYHFRPLNGMTIIDIGAGNGAEIHSWVDLVGESGRVIAIEPDPNCFRRLNKLVTVMKYKNVTLLEMLISDRKSLTTLELTESTGITSRVVANKNETIKLNQKIFLSNTFDEVVGLTNVTSPIYVKINVEGHELYVLNGIQEYLHLIKYIVVSCHDFLPGPEMHTYNSVINWLSLNGFSVHLHEENKKKPWESFYVYGIREFD